MLKNSHLLVGVDTEALCVAALLNADTVLPKYFVSNVSELLLAIEAIFLFTWSGPNISISPTFNSVENAVAATPAPLASVVTPVTVLDPSVTVILPVIVDSNAFELGHTDTFKLFPNTPGNLATQAPIPEIPLL